MTATIHRSTQGRSRLDDKVHQAREKWRRLGRRVRWTLLTVLVLLAVARAALPFALKGYVNRQLDRMPDYDGQIREVDVHLWRGAYRIHDVRIVKTTGSIPVPFFSAPQVDLSIEWKELFHGAVVGEAKFKQPEVHFVAGPTPDETQTGKDRPWDDVLADLFPFKINRVEIEQGLVHFQNFHSAPPVNIFLRDLTATATNLTNTRDLTRDLPAGLSARGSTVGGGSLSVDLGMNPLADTPTFELSAELTDVDLVSLNDFLKAYGKFDVNRGTFAVYGSFAAAQGRYDGYAKVFFKDLDVFAWEKERKKNIFEVFWQAIVGTASTVLRNQARDQVATKIPFSGTFEKTDVGIWTAATTLLRNAFIRALLPKLDESVTVEEVTHENEKK